MDAAAIFDFLSPEPDERWVLSWIAACDGTELDLTCASLLAGPPSMATSSWADWRGTHLPRDWPCLHQPDFVHRLDGWIVGRTSLPHEEVAAWLHGALQGTAPAGGSFPGARAALVAADAPFHVFPQTDGPLSNLIEGPRRPARGFFFPHAADDVVRGLPWQWRLPGDQLIPNAPVELLGIFVSDADCGGPAPAGLFVGRVERRAWLRTVRGGADLETFEAHIALDPERIDVADLEIEFEERIKTEVVFNQRVRLEDVPIGKVRGKPDFVVALPTMGTRVAHALRLRDRDGVLLDMTDPHYLVERIVLSVGLMDAPETAETVEIGDRPEPPSLLQRADQVRSVIDQFGSWFRDGLSEKVFRDADAARVALRDHLAGARGELRVFDSWFGYGSEDWSLLTGLDRPIRLLTTSGPRSVLVAPSIEGLEVRVWQRELGQAPFHDRGYVWDGGGVYVGTSPNGFGHRLFRMQRFGEVEAAALTGEFETWWEADEVRPAAAPVMGAVQA